MALLRLRLGVPPGRAATPRPHSTGYEACCAAASPPAQLCRLQEDLGGRSFCLLELEAAMMVASRPYDRFAQHHLVSIVGIFKPQRNGLADWQLVVNDRRYSVRTHIDRNALQHG